MIKLLFCKFADVFDRNRQFLFTSTVKINEKGEAELSFPVDVPIEEMEVEGYVTFYDDVEGLVTCWCSFFNLRRNEKEALNMMNTFVSDMVEQVQRRQDLKTSVRFKIEVDYTDHKGRPRFCQAEVENISAGGVFFTSEHKFGLGDAVVLRLFEIAPRLYTKTNILRIQALDDWESSPWLIRSAPPAPVKPPAPEGQNIFSFVRKKKEEEKNKVKTEPVEVAVEETEEEKRKMAFEEETELTDEQLRVVEEDIGGSTLRYGYGCQFKKIGQGNELTIRRFVFGQERLRLQSTRD